MSAGAPAQNPDNGRKLRLLLVDDENDITTVLKMGLEHQGFDVTTFNEPAEALSKYSSGKYDLVLLDIRMPKISGFELYRKIREVDPKVRVCFLTAFEVYFDEFRRIFPKLHVRCFAKKPISAADLRALIMEEMSSPHADSSSKSLRRL